ncbi:MAG: hypothetical protein ABIV06_01575 [Thermoanaerobaculia bacterium]
MPRKSATSQRRTLSSGSKAAKRASIAEWDALLARYPVGAPLDRVAQGAGVLAANACVLRLLWTGRMQPFDLVLLVLLEALLLTAIANVQMLFVPMSARMEKPRPLAAKLGVLLFALIWLAGVYGIFLGALLGSWPELVAAARDPWLTLRHSGIVWPLAITLVGAGVDAVRDGLHWKARGGYFMSTPGFYAGARWLTLFLGGIPFVLPFFALAIGLGTGVKRTSEFLAQRARKEGWKRLRARLLWLTPVAALLLLYGASNLLEAFRYASLTPLQLWALGYCFAKFASEAFVSFLPWFGSKARADEAKALGEEPVDATSGAG